MKKTNNITPIGTLHSLTLVVELLGIAFVIYNCCTTSTGAKLALQICITLALGAVIVTRTVVDAIHMRNSIRTVLEKAANKDGEDNV